jgi:allantoicase
VKIKRRNWFVYGRLGLPGIIHGVEIATDFFTGNFAPKASLQAARYK